MKAIELKNYCTGDCEECKFYKQPEYYPCNIIDDMLPYNWEDKDCETVDSFVELMNKQAPE